MQCANPNCRRTAKDLFTGTLRMLEMEVSPEKRTVGAESGFPVFAVPTRFFWMCETCSLVFKIRRWTPSGLILEPLLSASNHPAKIPPARQTVRAGRQSMPSGAA